MVRGCGSPGNAGAGLDAGAGLYLPEVLVDLFAFPSEVVNVLHWWAGGLFGQRGKLTRRRE